MNEGVKSIYSDMADLFLEAPIYSEPERQGVKLVLKTIFLCEVSGRKKVHTMGVEVICGKS